MACEGVNYKTMNSLCQYKEDMVAHNNAFANVIYNKG
jgi:hypothetical protein